MRTAEPGSATSTTRTLRGLETADGQPLVHVLRFKEVIPGEKMLPDVSDEAFLRLEADSEPRGKAAKIADAKGKGRELKNLKDFWPPWDTSTRPSDDRLTLRLRQVCKVCQLFTIYVAARIADAVGVDHVDLPVIQAPTPWFEGKTTDGKGAFSFFPGLNADVQALIRARKTSDPPPAFQFILDAAPKGKRGYAAWFHFINRPEFGGANGPMLHERAGREVMDKLAEQLIVIEEKRLLQILNDKPLAKRKVKAEKKIEKKISVLAGPVDDDDDEPVAKKLKTSIQVEQDARPALIELQELATTQALQIEELLKKVELQDRLLQEADRLRQEAETKAVDLQAALDEAREDIARLAHQHDKNLVAASEQQAAQLCTRAPRRSARRSSMRS